LRNPRTARGLPKIEECLAGESAGHGPAPQDFPFSILEKLSGIGHSCLQRRDRLISASPRSRNPAANQFDPRGGSAAVSGEGRSRQGSSVALENTWRCVRMCDSPVGQTLLASGTHGNEASTRARYRRLESVCPSPEPPHPPHETAAAIP